MDKPGITADNRANCVSIWRVVPFRLGFQVFLGCSGKRKERVLPGPLFKFMHEYIKLMNEPSSGAQKPPRSVSFEAVERRGRAKF